MNVVELFAGVGGFRVGLENSSKEFKTIFANQWEPNKKQQHAYNCYSSHFNDGTCINENISNIKTLVPKHDLLCGGFPCQDYSVASTGAKGIEGKKGVLWWEIRDIIESKKPKYILLENVDRLLKSPSAQRGRDFSIILKTLTDLGYLIEWRTINAAEYGFTQRRRRVFIFAYLSTTKFAKKLLSKDKKDIVLNKGFFSDIFPAHEFNEERNFTVNLNKFIKLEDLSKEYSGKYWNSGVCINGNVYSIDLKPNQILFNPLKNIVQDNVDEKYYLNLPQQEKINYLRGAKKIERTKPNGDKYYYSEGSMSPFDNLELPSRTMLTSESSINRSTHIIIDSKTNKLRFLTPVECERLNGFPDNWTNSGMPEKMRYFCMGNALVVGLIEKMGNKILKIK